MNFSLTKIAFKINKSPQFLQFAFTSQRWYAKAAAAASPAAALGKKSAKLGKLGPVVEKKVLPVETDPKKLVTYVCGSNIKTTGEDVKIKPDEEYPEWLWTLNTGPPKTLDELDPNTKEYWRKLRNINLKRNNKLAKLKKF